MKSLSFFATLFFAVSAYAAPKLSCVPGELNKCCPVGAVLNAKGQCVYPTKNGCPAGYHPQPHNTCCPLNAVLTDDGYCTDTTPQQGGIGTTTPGSDNGGDDAGGSTHACTTSFTGTTAGDAIGACDGIGGEVTGQSFTGSYWVASCQYGCQQ